MTWTSIPTFFIASALTACSRVDSCTLQGCEQPLAVVGGNCSVVGFGWQGTELFWNVAGDDVRCVAPCEGDLLVGSDDYEIRIFRKEESIYEISRRTRSLRCVRWAKEVGLPLD